MRLKGGDLVITVSSVSGVHRSNILDVGLTPLILNIEPINTFVQVGVDNIFDKQPPLLYLNNVLSANTDVSTYDLAGRSTAPV